MAEEGGYEAYHVPQQSRRDKLRVVAGQNQPALVAESTSTTTVLHPHHHHHHHHHHASSMLPLYDPCHLIPSNLLTCAPQHHHVSSSVVKEERSSNLMIPFGASSSSSNNSSHHNQPNYTLDLEPSNFPNLNPTSSIQIFAANNNNNNNNSSAFLYHHAPPPQQQNLNHHHHHHHHGGYGAGNEIMVFKPEPLSLSLSSQHNNSSNTATNNGNSNDLPLELNLPRFHGVIPGLIVGGGNSAGNNGIVGGSSSAAAASNAEVCRSSVVAPMGPFTGYASVLKGSRFLKPAQQLLEELCDVGGVVCGIGGGDDDVADAASLMMMEPPPSSSMDQSSGGGGHDRHEDVGDHHGVEGRKKSRLLTMLDEVYRRYRQYYQQMHAVVTSFEYVSGLSNAAPYASLAIKTMSKHFRCLKNAITEQLQFTSKASYHLSNRKDESPRYGNTDNRGPYSQRAGFLEQQPVWRPQRGLPERAVTVLRAWLFEHFLHPYPTDTDKLMLAKQTGLSRSQVSNWFINARVRLWKPMVEEIHMLETRQAQKNPQREEHNLNRSSDHLTSLDNSLVSENPSTSTDRFQDASYKRAMNQVPNIPVRSQEHVNLPCTSNQPVGVGVSLAGSASNNVSLTLGLHQNHGIGLADPFPLSAAQRFGLGLETNNEGYVMSGFESQNRHFGRDVIGGQLLHDFVG